ncbi:MAG: T9SS type A sorting domain-containing protein, partial [Bacteroidota bacterium]
ITLTLTDDQNLTSQTSRVVTVSPSGNGPLCYEELNGVLVMEAENYASSSPGTGNSANHNWQTFTDANASSSAGVRAMPNTGAYTGLDINGPRLDYEITFNTAGTYRVWVRSAGANSQDDSYHAGLDGVPVTTSTGYGMGSTGPWAWKDVANNGQPVSVVVPAPGQYVFNLWMREDGVEIDKIVLRINPQQPNGTGPAESGQTACGGNAPGQRISGGFNVHGQGQNAELSWGNFYEEFQDQFVLLRSTDGEHYDELNSGEIIVDQMLNTHVDQSVIQLEAEELYYRLEIRDAYGNLRQTLDASLSLRQAFSPLSLTAYPNPASGRLSLRYFNANEAGLSIRVLSSTGQTIHEQYLTENQQEGILKLNVSKWAQGIYFVQLSDGTNSKVERVMVY